MRALITRPEEDADSLVEPLRDRGVDVFLEPLLVILPSAGPAVDPTGMQGVLFTSANGVRAFAAASDIRHLPAWCVGDATARTARGVGFSTVHTAQGDVAALAALVRDSTDPHAGGFIHAAGTAVAGDLSGQLEPHGYTVRRLQLYEARPAARFSADLRRVLANGEIGMVVLYSPRTAATFAKLVHKDKLEAAVAGVVAYVLSPAVAQALTGLTLAEVRVAPSPNQAALLELFDKDRVAGILPVPSPMTNRGGRPVMTDQSKEDETKTGTDPATAAPAAAGPDKPKKDPESEGTSSTDKPEDSVSPEASGESTPDSATDSAPESNGDDGAKDEKAGTDGKPGPWGAGKDGDSADADPTTEAAEETEGAYGGSKGSAPVPANGHGAEAESKNGGGGGGGFALILVLVIVAGLVGAYPWWRPMIPEPWRGYLPLPPPVEGEREVTEMRGMIDGLRGRVEAWDADISSLKTDLEETRASVADLQARITEAAEAASSAGEQAAQAREEASQARTQAGNAAQAANAARQAAVAASGGAMEDLPAPMPVPQVDPALEGNVAALQERLGALAERLESLPRAPELAADEQPQVLRSDLSATQETVADAQDRIDELSKQMRDLVEDAVEPSTVLTLSDRVNAVEALARQTNTNRNTALALMLAVGQLRETAGQGEPFEAPLRTVAAIGKDSADIQSAVEALLPMAGKGVATRAQLRVRFEETARAVSKAALAPEGEGWVDRTLAALTSVVTVRRTEKDGSETLEGSLAKLARAERLVMDNDLVGAVAVLDQLEGDPAEAAAPWLNAAKARLAVEDGLSGLTTQALARMAAQDASAAAAKAVRDAGAEDDAPAAAEEPVHEDVAPAQGDAPSHGEAPSLPTNGHATTGTEG